MPRKRVVDPNEAQVEVDLRFHKKQGRPKKEESDDPRVTVPGGALVETKKLAKDTSGADRHTLYVRALVANGGDIIQAIANAYGVTEEYAKEHSIKLHEELRSFSRGGLSLQEMLERHDLTREMRLAVLRDAMFSTQPAVRLKAVEMLDEVDMTAKAARIGNTWEDIVRIAQDRASRRSHAKAR